MQKRKLLYLTLLILAACTPVTATNPPPPPANPAVSPSDPTGQPFFDPLTPTYLTEMENQFDTPQPLETEVAHQTSTQEAPEATTTPGADRALNPAPTNERVQDDNEYYFSQLIPYDGIRPIYNPVFASADEASLVAEELVMGTVINGEAKAYPVTVLQNREMVDDELGGLPILVSW